MTETISQLQNFEFPADLDRPEAYRLVRQYLEQTGYAFADVNENKPWGAYYRMENAQTDKFLAQYYPDLDPLQAKLGNADTELSPKILVVAPSQRLSLQRHARRAERWLFLTPGYYYKSSTDEAGEPIQAASGEVVQFAAGDTHRLCANDDGYTLVAEIWQHTDPTNASNEDDIVRLQDDYTR